MSIRTAFLAAFLPVAAAIPSFAATDIITDNFNAPDNANFDNSDQTNRRGGLLGPDVQLRSARVQHGIVGNQLRFANATGTEGRIRFHDLAAIANAHDFASGPVGATILTEGGMRVEFDWTPVNNTDVNWVEVSVGCANYTAGEGFNRVNHAATDFGILFRNNGGTQYFDNGAATTGPNFPATLTARHVVIDYAFTSFADGSNVSASASVDGTVIVTNRVFQWDGNAGVIFIEFGALSNNTLFDNFSIKTLATGFVPAIDKPTFFSSVGAGDLVATLSGTNNGVQEAGTYTLVAGNGDTDNAKFQINGNRLEGSGFNFQPAADGTQYSIRVKGTGNVSSSTTEKVFVLSVITDSDSDKLGDAWETAKAGNLTDLNGTGAGPGPGAGTGNFDGDSLSDAQEYAISLTTYPNINPKLADTDGDGLQDGAEITPTAPRLATNPTVADSDGDGLNDNVENNSGVFTDAASPGTNPNAYDTDGDQFPDGYEAARGGNPIDPGTLPTNLPAGVAFGIVTDEASTGISTAENFTHKISGGAPTTINGVTLDVLDTVTTPPNFEWNGFAGGKNIIGPGPNNNHWDPVGGNVTGGGNLVLFGTFTYSGAGPAAGNTQRFTLSGLEPGQTYETRVFIRKWDNSTVRPADLKFTNGAEVANVFILEDRPGIVLGNGNDNTAYYISYTYVAAGTSITLDATVPPVSSANGSFHLYGLTNRTAGPPPPLDFSSIVRAPNGASMTLTINSRPNHVYAVDYSTNLTTWIELADAVPATGTQTVYVDTIASNKQRAVYKVRDVTPP